MPLRRVSKRTLGPRLSLATSFCLVLSLVASLLLWGPSGQWVDPHPVQKSLRVRTAVAASGELVKSLRIGGSVETLHYAAIQAPELGPSSAGWTTLTLVKLAGAGSLVEAGSVVAEFDRKRLEDHIADRQSYVTYARANLQEWRSAILILQGAWSQRRLHAQAEFANALLDLRTAEVRSAIEAETLRAAAAEARAIWKHYEEEGPLRELVHAADLRYLELGVKKERLHVERHKRDHDRMQVRTLVGGMVIREPILNRSGEFAEVEAGDRINPGTLFMRIVDTSQMVIRATVNQVDAQTIRVGNSAAVKLDAYPGLQFAGRVTGMAALATRRLGTRLSGGNFIRHIAVQVLIEGKDERLLPGLTASADVKVSAGQRGVLVPREAIRHEPRRPARAFVLVVEGSEYGKRAVVVQDLSDTEALIRSGLKPGERVLLNRQPRETGGV